MYMSNLITLKNILKFGRRVSVRNKTTIFMSTWKIKCFYIGAGVIAFIFIPALCFRTEFTSYQSWSRKALKNSKKLHRRLDVPRCMLLCCSEPCKSRLRWLCASYSTSRKFCHVSDKRITTSSCTWNVLRYSLQHSKWCYPHCAKYFWFGLGCLEIQIRILVQVINVIWGRYIRIFNTKL